MIRNFKLKHLKYISETGVNYVELISEIGGYKNTWINKMLYLKKTYNKIFDLVKLVQDIDIKNVEISPLCKINIVENIDDIPFIAMMEIQSILGTETKNDLETNKKVGDIVAIACFNKNRAGDFDIEGKNYKNFRIAIDNSPMVDVFAIFNIIMDKLYSSKTLWEKLFLSVKVSDIDYDIADGGRMDKFNVINTVKSICSDFNLTYDQAWQVPYSLTQTNSLSKATRGYVENELSKLKENRMKTKRQ